MSRRTKADTGRAPSFADALRAAAESARLSQRTAARRLTESAESVVHVADLLGATCPLQARRLNRLAGELHGVATELAGDTGELSP